MLHFHSSLCPCRKQYPAIGDQAPSVMQTYLLWTYVRKLPTGATQESFAAFICWPALRILSTPAAQKSGDSFTCHEFLGGSKDPGSQLVVCFVLQWASLHSPSSSWYPVGSCPVGSRPRGLSPCSYSFKPVVPTLLLLEYATPMPSCLASLVVVVSAPMTPMKLS